MHLRLPRTLAPVLLLSLHFLVLSCSERGSTPGSEGGGLEGEESGGEGAVGEESESGSDEGDWEGEDALFDTLPGDNEGGSAEECEPIEHLPCDSDSTELAHAIGLNCPGELQFEVAFNGNEASRGLRQGFGPTDTWNPTEGSQFLVLGSGYVDELDNENSSAEDLFPHCDDRINWEPPYSELTELPAPLEIMDAGEDDCFDNPELIGEGDCSNTIQEQFSQGGIANDYTEMRIKAQVPPGINSLGYNFAFFTLEYPRYLGTGVNDMYIAWLESERWTGNISFDEMGNPISLNAGFFDYKDDNADLPELDGTCMKSHGGTKWLTTTSPVAPTEQIELIFAIFDLSDSIVDSYVFIDGFTWGCDGELPPSTIPIG